MTMDQPMKKGAMMRAWKNAISKTDARPVLENVHFDKLGFAVATDSHVLLRIDGANPTGQGFNLDLQRLTVQKDGGGSPEFPETNRLMPTSYDIEIKAPVTGCLGNLIPMLKGLKKGTLVHMTNDPDTPEHLYFETQPGGGDKAEFTPVKADLTVESLGGTSTEIDITLNAQYLLNCLGFFKDWEEAHRTPGLTIWYNGTLRPLLFKSEQASYLITPVRTF